MREVPPTALLLLSLSQCGKSRPFPFIRSLKMLSLRLTLALESTSKALPCGCATLSTATAAPARSLAVRNASRTFAGIIPSASLQSPSVSVNPRPVLLFSNLGKWSSQVRARLLKSHCVIGGRCKERGRGIGFCQEIYTSYSACGAS
jgi:hypothetical protein